MIVIGKYEGGTTRTWNGVMAWGRIGDNDRFNGTAEVDFVATVPGRIVPPADDGNTVSLWKMDEGAAAMVADSNANGNDGTLADGAWIDAKDIFLTPRTMPEASRLLSKRIGSISVNWPRRLLNP